MLSQAAIHLVHQPDRRPSLLIAMASEYLRLPGLAITVAQGSRLWSLEPSTCGQLLDALANAGFLRRRPDGRYVLCENRRAEGLITAPDAVSSLSQGPLAETPDAA